MIAKLESKEWLSCAFRDKKMKGGGHWVLVAIFLCTTYVSEVEI